MLPESKVKFSSKFFSIQILYVFTNSNRHQISFFDARLLFCRHAFFHFWHSLSYTHNFMKCRSRDGLAKKSLATGINKRIIPGIKDCINILTVRPNGLTSASPVETKTARLRMHRTQFRTISTTFLQLFDKGRLNEDVMMTYLLYLSHPFLIFSTFFHSWHSLRVRFFSPLVAKFSPKKCYF